MDYVFTLFRCEGWVDGKAENLQGGLVGFRKCDLIIAAHSLENWLFVDWGGVVDPHADSTINESHRYYVTVHAIWHTHRVLVINVCCFGRGLWRFDTRQVGIEVFRVFNPLLSPG